MKKIHSLLQLFEIQAIPNRRTHTLYDYKAPLCIYDNKINEVDIRQETIQLDYSIHDIYKIIKTNLFKTTQPVSADVFIRESFSQLYSDCVYPNMLLHNCPELAKSKEIYGVPSYRILSLPKYSMVLAPEAKNIGLIVVNPLHEYGIYFRELNYIKAAYIQKCSLSILKTQIHE